MNKEILELIFVNYWSQIVLVLGGGTYIFKNYFDRRSKLIELKDTILIQNKIDQLNTLNKKYCEISMYLEEMLISKYESSKDNEDLEDDVIKIDSMMGVFKEFTKLFRQVLLLSRTYRHDTMIVDFEAQFGLYIKLFRDVYQDEIHYKTYKLKLQLSKESLDYKFNELLIKYMY